MFPDISDIAVIAHCLEMKVQKANTCSKSTIETKEKGVKYVQN